MLARDFKLSTVLKITMSLEYTESLNFRYNILYTEMEESLTCLYCPGDACNMILRQTERSPCNNDE